MGSEQVALTFSAQKRSIMDILKCTRWNAPAEMHTLKCIPWNAYPEMTLKCIPWNAYPEMTLKCIPWDATAEMCTLRGAIGDSTAEIKIIFSNPEVILKRVIAVISRYLTQMVLFFLKSRILVFFVYDVWPKRFYDLGPKRCCCSMIISEPKISYDSGTKKMLLSNITWLVLWKSVWVNGFLWNQSEFSEADASQSRDDFGLIRLGELIWSSSSLRKLLKQQGDG